ncbi:MAG: transcriptional repressor LexA [Clostridium sp.]
MYFDLKGKQIFILEYIKEQIALKGYPPSVREICLAVDLKSPSTVHSHLNALEKLGYIRRDPTKPRAIEVLDQNKYQPDYGHIPEILQIPLVGQITAGASILAEENIEKYISLPANLVNGSNNFALKIKGDSMINAGILNGDFVVVDKKHNANNDDIVVAIVHNEYVTVKKFEQDDDTIKLKPENNYMDTIILNSKYVSIVGVVTGVFRIL